MGTLPLAAVFIALAMQGVMITWLLIERHGRRSAEVDARNRLTEVIHPNRSAEAWAPSAPFAHELSQPLEAILLSVATAEHLLEPNAPETARRPLRPRSTTRARASPSTSSTKFSIPSIRPRPMAPASTYRSPAPSSRPTAARSGRKIAAKAGRCFVSPCRCLASGAAAANGRPGLAGAEGAVGPAAIGGQGIKSKRKASQAACERLSASSLAWAFFR